MAKRTAAKRKPPKKAKRKAAKRRPAEPMSVPRVALETPPAGEEKLKSELDAAISAFNSRRTAILKKAFDEGGDEQVAKLEQQQEALRAAFFELLKKQLDRNNAQYVELTTSATRETTALKAAIESLANVANILNRAASVVKLVGKVTTVLAL